jgi:uncharacterized repeat protein (TIGR03847 family)
MAKETDVNPVTHITADAIGPPGKRVFYLQAQQNTRTITLIVEKFQVQSLASGVEEFMADIQQKFPHLKEASTNYIEANMYINPPVDPLFRVGELALGYDADADRMVLIARELVPNQEFDPDAEPIEGRVIRFWCTRDQLRKLAHWGIEVAKRGRPLCTQCGAPIDPEEGHFCPKKNGHRG